MAKPTHFHDYVTVVTDIDRRKYGERVVPMKVLCLGLPRTGTDSLRRALKLLGINDVYHGFPAFFENPRDCEMWYEAHKSKFENRGKPFGRDEFDKLLGHCQAVADHPCCVFAEELVQAYPEAKVILTTRPDNDWFCYAFLVFQMDMHRLFGDNFTADGKRRYREHNDMIRSLVPKDKLLELRLGQHGWDPLCKFLNVDIPKADYPRTNSVSDLNKKLDLVTWYACREVVATVGTSFLAVLATLYAVHFVRATLS
ncbi:hypothetical protein IMSHALPRED_003661 [Imshaugia aleurites]|uniref:Sulfotransferase n=1 Tax=Imshaugia aleurites TaxID=172621 RepID=A0A8H3J876_9LECA|nr:hypothetical protein IMSHALPRED_003661 [Imshaugia aleurites]